MTPDPTPLADSLLRRLFPICRSITGNGVRETLRVLQTVTPFEMHEVPSGTPCFDWVVPDEWNVRDAFVADPSGRRVIDFHASNIHLVSYSIPFEGDLTFEELRPHLHTLPDLPDAIPYRTAYYKRTWGFCLTHRQLEAMDRQATYHVRVDTTLAPGSLTYGEALLPGSSGREYLFSTYCCHPSLANDNLSGPVLWTLLLAWLRDQPRRHSYRFIIIPETIGALAYLALHADAMRALSGAFVVATVAGPGRIGYKRTFLGDHYLDRLVRQTFREFRLEYVEYPFDAGGSDERQYSSPGFRIPTGMICKDKYYEYPYYHTSLDNLDFARAEYLVQTLRMYQAVIENLEHDRVYRSLNPNGEPMLGRRGLYPQVGGSIRQQAAGNGQAEPVAADGVHYGDDLDAIRWLLFYGDGKTSLLEIAERTGLPVRQLRQVAETLCRHQLLVEEN